MGRPILNLENYYLTFLTNHFNNKETQKLTTAPSAARITVFTISDEPTFTATVKAVPETVPRIVPLSMLLCVDINNLNYSVFPASALVDLLNWFMNIRGQSSPDGSIVTLKFSSPQPQQPESTFVIFVEQSISLAKCPFVKSKRFTFKVTSTVVELVFSIVCMFFTFKNYTVFPESALVNFEPQRS
jgi:hypothetical protein